VIDPDESPSLPAERVYRIGAFVAGQMREEALALADGLDDPVALDAAELDQSVAVRYAELADVERLRRRRHEAGVAWSLGVRPGEVTVEDDTDAS
jgi:hypothetical protein